MAMEDATISKIEIVTTTLVSNVGVFLSKLLTAATLNGAKDDAAC